MPKVVSKILHEYAKTMRAPGDVYEVEERHLEVLRRLGRVELHHEKPAAKPADGAGGTYQTASIAAAPVMKTEPQPRRTRQRASLVGAPKP